jgi:hypothetical protein
MAAETKVKSITEEENQSTSKPLTTKNTKVHEGKQGIPLASQL